jgi:hypothetical protein
MSRIANALAVFGLAVALAGLSACEPVQNPNGTDPSKAATIGSSSNFGSGSSSMPMASSSGTVAGGTIDSPQSQGLSDYLKHHSLPLVGAQVVTSTSGGKQVILFGFVASDFGKTDAEQKARHYLKDSSLVVDNRIKISPELAGGHGSSGSTGNGVPSSNAMPSGNAMPSDGSDPYASSGSIQDYQNNEPPGAQAYQQQGMQQYQQYNSAPPSMLTTILPMLLGGGMTIGGGSGGFGGGMGGFSSGYAPSYGGYGYPSYPPPMPNSGFGASGFPF